MKCQKWRIFPTRDQRATLVLWFDAARMVYNRAAKSASSDGDASMEALRWAAGTSREEWFGTAPERLWSVPYEVRDSPLRDLHKAAAALRAKARKGGRRQERVQFKFRRRKDTSESLTLRKRCLNCKTTGGDVWPALFGTTEDRSAMRTERGKTLPGIFLNDTRLFHDRRTDKYYLCIPMVVPETQGRPIREVERDGVVAIDPGVRTFATCYNPGGEVTDWGTNGHILGWISRKAARIDRRAEAAGGRRRRRMRACAARLRERMRDLAAELHRKLARWLCLNNSAILLPRFDVQRISRKARRNISRGTVKDLSHLAHFRFRQFLAHKAHEMDATLVICGEQFTSKTCGRCGRLNDSLGASKAFVCPGCAYAADRDHNAARNILLRYCVMDHLAREGGK
jgi:putative transposase